MANINKSKSENLAAMSVILSGILWGMITIFIKNFSAQGIDAMQISLIRMAVAAPIFTLFLLITDKSKLKISPKDSILFIGTGIISVVIFNICYFYTMIHSQASIAVVLLYTSPVFVMILSAIFYREKITKIKLAALLLTVAGCALVAGVFGSGYKLSVSVLLIGLCSGLSYALYTIFGRAALKKYDPMTVTVWTFIFALPASIIVGKPLSTAKAVFSSPKMILLSLGIAVVSTILPYFFYTWGLKRMDNGKASILVAVEPVVGSALGIIVYSEPISVSKAAGILLVLGAVILLNLPQRQKINDNPAKNS